MAGAKGAPDFARLLATLQATTAPGVHQDALLRRRLRAAASLEKLAGEEHYRSDLMLAGAVRPIVSLLTDCMPDVELAVARIVRALAATEACRASILAADALPRLVAMARYGNRDASEEAAAALGALAYPEVYRARVVSAGAVPALVEVLACCAGEVIGDDEDEDGDNSMAAPGVSVMSRSTTIAGGGAAVTTGGATVSLPMLSQSSITASGGGSMMSGTVPVLTTGEKHSRHGKEAAATLLTLTVDSEETRSAIIALDAIPSLVQLLSCQCRETYIDVLRLLAELGDSTVGKAAILESGAVRLSKEEAEQVQETATQVFRRNSLAVPTGEAGGPLVELLLHEDVQVRAEAAAVLAALGTKTENEIEPGEAPAFDGARVVLAAGALEPLVKMLSSTSERGRTQAARALFNLALPEKDEQRDAIVAAGCMAPLVSIVRSGEKGSAEERAWAAAALRLLAASPDRRRALEEAVPIIAPYGRQELMKQIHAYCF